ncbi:hypothetical protein RRG08_019240 [Elysia crispata]|uniref:Uncharacterized protein n=1 Tax=Elysia crispata TaxID=231223 RepID=A0AAE1E4E7_9GAST|nr:hypothetical protein RRG08_019240 [Elysia crispata]
MVLVTRQAVGHGLLPNTVTPLLSAALHGVGHETSRGARSPSKHRDTSTVSSAPWCWSRDKLWGTVSFQTP